MEKSIYSQEQRVLSGLLRTLRIDAALRQSDVAERLGVNQTFVSKYERGERRLDLIELEQVCNSLGVGLEDFVRQFRAERRRVLNEG